MFSDTTYKEIIPNTALTFVDAMYGGHHCKLGEQYKHCLVEGQMYKVTIDNKTYTMEAKNYGSSIDDNASGIYLGDGTPMVPNFSEYGFAIGTALGTFMLCISQEVFPEDPTMFKLERVDTKIKESYIPSSIQRVGEPLYLTDSAGAKWQLVVGEDGTLSSMAVTE